MNSLIYKSDPITPLLETVVPHHTRRKIWRPQAVWNLPSCAHSSAYYTPSSLRFLQPTESFSLRALTYCSLHLEHCSPQHTCSEAKLCSPPSGLCCMSAYQQALPDHPQHSLCPFPAITLTTFWHVICSIVFTCWLLVLLLRSKLPEGRVLFLISFSPWVDSSRLGQCLVHGEHSKKIYRMNTQWTQVSHLFQDIDYPDF